MSSSQWVSFVLGDELFACRVAKVQEIIPYTEPVPVPGGPAEVSGILNVRGEIIPVLKTAQLLNTSASEAERIIILDDGEELTGMAVDKVGEIISVSPQDIDHSVQDNEHIRGTVLHRERLV
ncbi:MAG: chemotaxis protein CheW, partial [Oleiphilaceae bacterium]|nr:chemotaxis protein CheW [Oleiphilaceae bacterium]